MNLVTYKYFAEDLKIPIIPITAIPLKYLIDSREKREIDRNALYV